MANRRQFLGSTLLGFAVPAMAPGLPRFGLHIDSSVQRIAFGSCVSQRKDQTIWREIARRDPDVFVMLGDGIYPEHEGADLPVMEAMASAYEQAATREELARFRAEVPLIAIWDDNDYGGSDVGRTFDDKQRSREMFLDFWCSETERAIRRRDSGIYGLWEFGAAERRTQIIVPDLRYCRSEWAWQDAADIARLRESGFGPYAESVAGDVTILGEEQWRWLAACLERPAKLRLLASSIQCLAVGRGWESWSNFPHERRRLQELIASTGAEGVVILSGDSHYAELSRLDSETVGYPLWEATSSGLTESWPTPGPNPNRVGSAWPEPNFGLLHVNWAATEPMLVIEFYAATGRRLVQHTVRLNRLAR